MKFIFLIALLILTAKVSARVLNCEIIDQINPPTWPKEYLSIQLDRSVTSLDYIHKIPKSDGTFLDKIENLYSGMNRGGYSVSYCNPNDNEYIESIGKINLYSQCVFGNTGDKLFFDASLSTKDNGKVNILIASLNGNEIERSLEVFACHY